MVEVEKYTKETIKKGAVAGVYNTNLEVLDWNYLIGDFGGTTVTLVNIKTGMIHTCLPSDIYKPKEQAKNYLDYDQEVMKVGDKVTFRLAKDVSFEITKVTPMSKSCNLYSKTGVRLYDIPLSYLKFSDPKDSIVIDINKKKEKKEEKTTMPKTKKDNVIKKAFDEKQKALLKTKTVEEKKEDKGEDFEFGDITITIKKKGKGILVKCKDDMYYGTAFIDNYQGDMTSIASAIQSAFENFCNEDKRKRNNIFMPEIGENYLRYGKIETEAEFDESKLEWINYSGSIENLYDINIGNIYRDGHEARSDFYRLKNIILQMKKQIIEKTNKEPYEEED